jgi:hypothetical protein
MASRKNVFSRASCWRCGLTAVLIPFFYTAWARSCGPVISALALLSEDKQTSGEWVKNDAIGPKQSLPAFATPDKILMCDIRSVRLTMVALVEALYW